MTQIDIETTYNKQNINMWVMEEIHASITTDDMFIKAVTLVSAYKNKTSYYKSKQERVNKLATVESFDIVVELFKHVLMNQESTVAHLAATIGSTFYENQMDAVKMGAEILGVCESIGLYEITVGTREMGEDIPSFVKSNFSFDDVTIQKIHTAMYLPPMLTAPRDWTDNRHGGLLLSDSSCILGKGNDVGQHQCLDVLNTLQEIRWTLNQTMLTMPELMSKETNDTRKVKQHNDRMLHSKTIYELIGTQEFNFMWKNDKRGRSYSQGYDINLQGSDYKKAIIQFADEEIVEGI